MGSLTPIPERKRTISTQEAILELKLKGSTKLHLAKDGGRADFNSNGEKSV